MGRIQTAIGLFCLLLGGGLLYIVPVQRYDCSRVSSTRVDCTMRKSVLGVIPIARQEIASVVSAEYSSQTRDSETQDRRRGSSTTSTTAYFHVRLLASEGQVLDSGETAFVFGDTSEEIVAGVNALIADPAETTVSAWQGQWFPMLAGGIFFVFGALSVYPFVLRPSLLLRRDPPAAGS